MMQCPQCNAKLKKVAVEVEDAKTKAVSYQCPNCVYVNFDSTSTIRIVRELSHRNL